MDEAAGVPGAAKSCSAARPAAGCTSSAGLAPGWKPMAWCTNTIRQRQVDEEETDAARLPSRLVHEYKARSTRSAASCFPQAVRRPGCRSTTPGVRPATDSWKALAPLPTSADRPSARTVADKMYVRRGATTLPGRPRSTGAPALLGRGGRGIRPCRQHLARARADSTPAITPRPAW